MAAGMAIGLLTSLGPESISLAPVGLMIDVPIQIGDFGLRLMMITLVTTAIWVPVMYLTPPESPETRQRFYRLARPGGPGWSRERLATRLEPIQSLQLSLIRAGAAVFVLYGLMFGISALLLLRPTLGAGLLAVAAAGGAVLYSYRDDEASPNDRRSAHGEPEPVTLPQGDTDRGQDATGRQDDLE